MNTPDIPWVEKYRPDCFDDIIISDINKSIFSSIFTKQHFPNMLFYGPPGTGKTTTIINLVNKYFKNIDVKNSKSSILHLNASDDRGIDIIRNQILQFVNTNSIYKKGLKFVILDEVDYMTKNAQTALKRVVQNVNDNVRFCLICNYISRIDNSLRNEFICIRFNKLPTQDVNSFLVNIIEKENLNMDENAVYNIQHKFGSDVRSMINYIQLNSNKLRDTQVLLDKPKFDEIYQYIHLNRKTPLVVIEYLKQLSCVYNNDITEIIKEYINYLLSHRKTQYLNVKTLNKITHIIHQPDINIEHKLGFLVNNIII
jgi:replication factor C subunit 3/5